MNTDMEKVWSDLNDANSETIKYFLADLKRYYTGRPTPMLLDGVKIEYYGEWVPLDHAAVIVVSNADMLMVTPFIRSMTKDIERAIHKANLGLNPQADSECVKVYLPKRTKEADKEIFKLIKDRAEMARVAVRYNRQHARNAKLDLTEDEMRSFEKDIQVFTDVTIEQINEILENKRKEMRV